MKVVAWAMFIVGMTGLLVTFPMWLMDLISDRTMIGITLALSWGALIFEGANAIFIQKGNNDD